MDSVVNIRESAWDAFNFPPYAYTLACPDEAYRKIGINISSKGREKSKKSDTSKRSGKALQG